ncbi:E3 SUMO-protein ligase RanBP2 [Clonorchis sinensis]|nr:E3 SUMO-protein ligase RanBP2 [Clonorchis sinensis]
MWLLRRYPSTYPENPLNSLSWNELLDLVHGEMKENRPVQSSQLNESTVSATKDTSLDVPEHLLQTSYNAVLMTPENLSLILWLCAQQSGMSSELKDNTLSNGRVEFLSKLVSTCFSSLDVSNLPLPFTECQSAVAVPADTACQLDLVCFLLAAFLQAAIRSLAGTSSSTGVGSQWIKSPVCITPTVLQPSVVQKQWWTACLGMTLPRTADRASPGYSLSKVDSPGSQQIYHVLFTLPSDCNWWLGVQNPDSSKKVEWHWFNSGVCYLLTQLTRRSKEGGCVSDYGKTILRRLIRLLDGFDVHLSREAYRLGGQLLLTCTPENRILGYDEANAYTDNVSNSVAGDSLSNAQRARFYLERSSKSPQTIDNHSPADWHTPQSVDKSTPFRFRPSAWTDSVSTSLIVNRSSSPANSILDSRLNDTVEFPYIHLPLTPHASGGRLGNRQPDEDFRVENKTPANIHSLVPAGAESTDELDSSQYDVLSRSQEMLMSSFLSTWQSLVNGLSCQLAETKAELSRSRQLNEELSKQLNDTSKQLAEAINKFVECQEKLSKQSNQSVTAAANSDSFTDAIKLLQTVSAHFSPQIPTSRAVFNSAEAAALMQFCGSNAPFATFNQIPVQSVPVNWRAPFFHPASNNPVPVPAEFKPRAPSSGIAATYVPSTVQQNGGVDFVNHQPDQTAGLTRQPNSLLASASLFPGASAPSSKCEPMETYCVSLCFPFISFSLAWENSSLRRDAVPKPPGRPDVTEQSFLTASLTTPIRPTSVVQSPAQLTFGSDRLRQDPNTSASLSTHGSRPLLGSGTDSPNYPTQPVVTNACTEPKPLLNLGLFQPSTISATISSRAAPIETKGTLASAITPEKPSLFGLENLSTSGSTPNSISLSSSAKPFGHSSPQQAHFSSVKSPSTSRNEEDSDQCPEAYEPKVDFTPVVSSLPDLIEQYTGEENEERLFADRARLFRFDKPTGSWKTRGVGEVRILHDIGGDKYRLVMRRDQVKKLCANHAITSNVHVTISTKDPRMAMWAVRDYAECPEGKDETFMIQFKSTELLQQFMDVVRECVTKCTSKSAPTPSTTTAASPVTNIPKANPEETHREEAIDLNAKFGLKPGEWNCSVCLVRNASGTSKCIACQTAKPVNPNETPKSEPASAKDPLLLKFAPQPGSWDCPTCMLHHTSTVQTCPACNTAKPSSGSSAQSSKPPSSTQLFGGFIMGGGGFVFGQQKPTSSTTDTATVTPSKPLFSFVGSASKPTTLFTPSPPQGSATTKVVSSTASLAADTKPLSSTFTKPSVFYFGRDPTSTTPATGPCVESEKTDKAGGAFASLNLLNGLGKTSGFSFNFGSSKTEGDTSKTVTSPTKDDDSPDTDQVELVDEEKLTFKPALAVMPDKIVLRTGEENEDIIFCERAKLYRWDVSVWRERGVGELKLLRNPSTGSVRCLMRRDHVLKVCCNHPITFGMQLKPMSAADGRAWTWWAIDFTEPSPDEAMNKSMDHSLSIDVAGGRPETFAVRFKTTEHAQLFKDVFNDAVAKAEKSKSSTATQELATKIQTVDLDGQNEPSDSDDVCVVEKPPEVTEEQLSRARQLRLPDEFYAFENGCVSGEAEPLTEQEEAEEDALLEAAIQRAVGARQRPDNSGESESDHVLKTEGAGALPTVSSQGDTAPTSTPSKSTSLGVPTSTNGTTTSLLASSKGTQLNSAFDGFSQSAGKLLDFSSLSANLSSDSKPTWGSPSAESKAQQSVWASATTPMFAAHTKKHELENGTEESGEQDPHYEPIISLPELVQTKSGEESELCLFFGRCRAYRFVDGAWKERGVGNIKVLVQPQSVPKGCKLGSKEIVPNDVDLGVVDRSRLLMRRDQVLKLCINQLIGSDVPMFKPMGNTGVCWVGEDYSEGSAVRETFAVRFKDETDLASFKAAVTRARNLLKKI